MNILRTTSATKLLLIKFVNEKLPPKFAVQILKGVLTLKVSLLTWDFSIVALKRSHIGDMSRPVSRSLSPCWKNSSMILSHHWRYSSRGLVGLLRSAQWTMFCSTWEKYFQTWYLSLSRKTLLFFPQHFIVVRTWNPFGVCTLSRVTSEYFTKNRSFGEIGKIQCWPPWPLAV